MTVHAEIFLKYSLWISQGPWKGEGAGQERLLLSVTKKRGGLTVGSRKLTRQSILEDETRVSAQVERPAGGRGAQPTQQNSTKRIVCPPANSAVWLGLVVCQEVQNT